MAQSPVRCGGSWVALVLLKASARSLYSAGSCDSGMHVEFVAELEGRQFCLQDSDH